MSTDEWSGKGWIVTVTDTEMALAQASGSVTISSTNAARLEVRHRWFRWRLYNEGRPLVRPLYRADGKILRSARCSRPDISKVLLFQLPLPF